MHGLDWYDYGARHYDAVIERWTTMDPLCEKYYDVSPYAYCVNNPVRYVDIDGKNPGDHFASLYEAVWDFSWIYNVLSIEKNIEYLTKIYYVQTADNDSYYTYLDPNSGNENSVKGGSFDYSVLNIHDKLEMIAYGHTHADWDKNLVVDGIDWNDNFSGDQFNSEKNKQWKGYPSRGKSHQQDDISIANEKMLPMYLVTPNGSLKKYNPKIGYVVTLNTKMPHSKLIDSDNNRIVKTRWELFKSNFKSFISNLF